MSVNFKVNTTLNDLTSLISIPFLLPTLFSLSSDNSKQAPFNSRKAFYSGRNKKEAIREDLDELKYLLYEKLLENVFRLEFDICI